MTPIQFTRNVRSLNRLRQIAQVLTRHGFGHIVAQVNLARLVPVWMLRKKGAAERREEAASTIGRRIAAVCGELGPTYIKLGQIMSTRPDVVPEDVLAELRKLQDEVPPFDTATAMELVTQQLGCDLGERFTHIDERPFASASIGQVYRAETTDGMAVVVKVRRPDIAETIKLDMQLLKWLAESLENFMPELRVYRPTMLVDELDLALTRELDYVNEASATTRFAEAFADDPGIRVPRVRWDLTGPHVLTLEALEGTNLDKLLTGGETTPHVDRKTIARRLADCYLKQIFELGTFHADPHPGNILIDPPASIGLIDYGQIGTLTDELMTDLIVMVYAAVNREMEVVVDTLADLGALSPDTDTRNLRRSLQTMLDKYYGLPLGRFDISTLLSEYADIMRRNDVVIPRDLSLLFKALGTVGGVANRLDPELNLLELMQPRIRKALLERLSPKQAARTATLLGWDMLSILRRAPGQLRNILRRISTRGWELHVRHENIDRLIRELDRSSNRIAFSVVIAAIIVGSSVVISAGSDVQIFGVKVHYIGIVGYLLAGVLGLGLSWAIFRSGRLH